MILTVVDNTAHYPAPLAEGVRRWNEALAAGGRDIQLVVQQGSPQGFVKSSGVATVTDLSPAKPGEWGDGGYDWSPDPSTWSLGYVELWLPAGHPQAADLVVHELGHVLMESHVPDGTASVMTEHLSLGYPTPMDVAGAMPGYPRATPTIPPAPPPHKRKHKKRRH